MLPLRTGFILGDGTILETHGGHWKTAYNFIRQNPQLLKAFNESNFYEEEDFLIFTLHSIKLFQSRGSSHLVCSQVTNIKKNKLIKRYIQSGYILHILKEGNDKSATIISEGKSEMRLYNFDYNTTVIRAYDEKYCYNPARIGD